MLVGIPLAAILIPTALTWVKDLNPSTWRVRRLDEQSKLVDFWDNWIKAVSSPLLHESNRANTEELINALFHEARIELAKAGKNVLSLYRATELRDYHEFKLSFTEFQRYRAGLSWFRRAFLVYKSPNRIAKFAKWTFYWNFLSPFVIAPIEVPLLEYTKLGRHPLPAVLAEALLSSRVNGILFIALAIVYWAASSIFLRNRSIRLENDHTLYLTR